MQAPMVASGGFEDSAVDAALAEPVAQGAATGLVVVEAALRLAGQHVDIEVLLADIDAGHNDGGYTGADRHSCVPFLLKIRASNSSFRTECAGIAATAVQAKKTVPSTDGIQRSGPSPAAVFLHYCRKQSESLLEQLQQPVACVVAGRDADPKCNRSVLPRSLFRL